jgi:hypothetical protein
MQSTLEHINITVSDTAATAVILAKIFNWEIRWSGASKDNGKTVHLGTNNTYLALYSHADTHIAETSFKTNRQLNHIGIQVGDLDAIETKTKAAGLVPHNHDDY